MSYIFERKPNYYETDQMAIIHHSNYIRWFEEARMDFLDKNLVPMSLIEENGIQIPVLEVQSQYKKMIRLSDTAYIHMDIAYYNGTRLNIEYKLYNQRGELCNIGSSKHCFITKEGRPINFKKKCPSLSVVFE